MSTDPLSSRVLVIGGGFTGLVTARVLCDDGFARVHLVADGIGGTWNLGEAGGVYPGLLTNSGYGGFELSGLEMPKDDLDATTGRIKAETIASYLQRYFDLFVKNRADVRANHRVMHLSRPSSRLGWVALIRDERSGVEQEELFDKVVLAQGPLSAPHIPEPLRSPTVAFKGVAIHTARLHGEAYQKVIDTEGPIVVVGGGKSAIDIAAHLTNIGKDVTVVCKKMRVFAPLQAPTLDKADYAVGTRLFSTLVPDECVTTWVEWLLHKTRLGGMISRKILTGMDEGASRALKVDATSPLMFGQPDIVWRGPDHFGGRASVDANSFHGLHSAGRIPVHPGVTPVAISDDGSGIRLSDGNELPAAAIVLATGFESSFNFIPFEARLELGLEPVPPVKDVSESPIASYALLANPPGPPSAQPASHVYKGLVPSGALESRDIILNGFAFLLRQPYTSEVSAHWISSFFAGDRNLRLPASNAEAFEIAEAHAVWLRHRFPLSTVPWRTHTHHPAIHAPHYNDGLIADMGLPLRQEASGLVSYYAGQLRSSGLATLGAERRALRVPPVESPSLVGRALSWLGFASSWTGGMAVEGKKAV